MSHPVSYLENHQSITTNMTKQMRKQKITELTNKYRFAFVMWGAPSNGYNTMRLAAFLSTKKPKEYELFAEDDNTTLVFWNPYEKNTIEQS